MLDTVSVSRSLAWPPKRVAAVVAGDPALLVGEPVHPLAPPGPPFTVQL